MWFDRFKVELHDLSTLDRLKEKLTTTNINHFP